MLQNKLHVFVDRFTEALVSASQMYFSTQVESDYILAF